MLLSLMRMPNPTAAKETSFFCTSFLYILMSLVFNVLKDAGSSIDLARYGGLISGKPQISVYFGPASFGNNSFSVNLLKNFSAIYGGM